MEIAAAQREVELISRAYARLYGIERTDDWLLLKLSEEVGELTQAYLAMSGRSRRTAEPHELRAAVQSEVADVLGQVLLIAQRFGVDLDEALNDKWFQWRHLVTLDDQEDS